jgi:hypothetical protein
LFSEFSAQQDAVLSLVDEIPDLGRNSVKSTRKFLQKFFIILNSDDRRQKEIVEACQGWPPSATDHTTPGSNLR